VAVVGRNAHYTQDRQEIVSAPGVNLIAHYASKNNKNMKLSKLTIGFGVYLVVSAAFASLVWKFIEKSIGKSNAQISGAIFLCAFAFFVLVCIIKSRLSILKVFMNLVIISLAFLFAWRQPFFVEKFHVIEYGLLGWLATRDLNKDKISLKNILLALLFASLIGVLDEGFQKLLPYRVCEMRDALTNIVSVAFGTILFLIR